MSLAPIILDPVIPLWKHQAAAVAYATPLPDYALLFEMGAGKTPTAINILRNKCAMHRRPLRTLILCPLIVTHNWRDELARHSKFKDSEICILAGPGKKRVKQFMESSASIFITNYEALLMGELFDLFEQWKIEMLILDESHRCKEMRAKRTKRAVKLADNTMYRLLMTGSPILKDPMDLFSQFLILDRGQTFGRNFFVFRSEYFWDKNAGMPKSKYFPDWRLKPGAEQKISAKIAPKSMRVEKKDCLDLPPLVNQKIYIELSPMQRKLYDEMKRDFITFVDGQACAAPLAMIKGLRLQEILSGYVTVEGEAGYEVKEIEDNPRADACAELLREITPNAKVLVWASFRQNYVTLRRILDKLGVGYVFVTGDQDDAEKKAAIHRFHTDDKCRVFVGNPGSGGIGINLTIAPYAIFYSRNFNREHKLQAEARNHRGGSEIHDQITQYDLIAKGTMDEKVLERHEMRETISLAVLRDLVA